MNRSLQEALSSLRQEHQEIGAPDSVKRGLVALVEAGVVSGKSPQRSWFRVAALGAALAACSAVGVFYRYHATPALHVQPVTVASLPNTLPAAGAAQERSTPSASKGKSPAAHTRTGKRPTTAPAMNDMNPFITLPSSEGLPAPSMATLVRMQIRRDELRQYGFDVSPAVASEMVLAEFVVGQDGLSRAVRFVR
ncbi:hypothetical protein AB4Y89_05875 [Terriglobus sp. 2YAB30_2]|uniref:hypothetical protein n=1 Tax=unclassified Terriglobus TaxID=2628988 RepID=UPI003F95E63B